MDVHVADGVRLQKVLATAGLGSRRACERLIEDGRVEVDGQIVTELGVRVDPATAVVHVDGMRLQLDTDKITIVVNKPVGVVSTMDDPEGRPSLRDYVKDRSERLFHVGRLDTDSEGVILLTNDGELANRLAHPGYGIAKTYLVQVNGKLGARVGSELLHGVELDDGPAKLDRFHVVDSTHQATLVEVVLHEGRNRIVRRMFAAAGHPVVRLVRTQVGPIKLGDLPPGRHRVLGQVELGTLMAAVGL
ncbi:MAG: pseudouridine synthase [Cellulomonadaceae bacterium]